MINCESTWLGLKYASWVNSFFEAAHEKIKEYTNLKMYLFFRSYRSVYQTSLLLVKIVLTTFIMCFCNTRIQECISSTKQQMPYKKGLVSTVDNNLRPILFAQHTKLETKFNEKQLIMNCLAVIPFYYYNIISSLSRGFLWWTVNFPCTLSTVMISDTLFHKIRSSSCRVISRVQLSTSIVFILAKQTFHCWSGET